MFPICFNRKFEVRLAPSNGSDFKRWLFLGPNCVDFFETLCTADIRGLADNSASLTVFTNDNGGILDDLIVTKVNEEFLYVVSNAAMKNQDQQIMTRGLVRLHHTLYKNEALNF